MTNDVTKAVGLPETIDASHEYVYRSGEYGIYYYWYKDRAENYWKYTNAPEDHVQFDPHAGPALMDPDQPMPHMAPEFYTPEGRKRHLAVPQGIETEVNPGYDPANDRNVWYELYRSQEGETRFVYLDTDIRENIDLYVQHQLRVADAGLTNYRQMAANLFAKVHPKDRVTGAILMLVDQAFFEVPELAEATVGDLEFTDNTIRLLGRKLVADPQFHDFMTSLVGDRDPSAPLFVVDTVHGRNKLGLHYLYSVFASLKVSPHFLLYWHASHLFSRIINRLAFQKIPVEEIEEKALGELARVFSTRDDVQHLVDYKLRTTLLDNYSEGADAGSGEAAEGSEETKEPVGKSLDLDRMTTDAWGVSMVFSDLVEKRGDELEFSSWLHAQALHNITPDEQAVIDDALEQQAQVDQTEKQQAQQPPQKPGQGPPGQPGQPPNNQGAPPPQTSSGGTK